MGKPDWLWSPVRISRGTVVRLGGALAAVTSLRSGLELLKLEKAESLLGADGALDWSVERKNLSGLPRTVVALIDRIAQPRVTLGILRTRVLASIIVIARPSARPASLANIFLGVTGFLLSPRFAKLMEGSDHASATAQLNIGLSQISKSPRVKDIFLWNISAQSACAYFFSGLAKLCGPSWRNGSAVSQILRTRQFGNEPVYRFARAHPVAFRLVDYCTIFFELAFPVVFFSRGRLTKLLMAIMTAMHAGIAFSMGLGRFLTAYPSMLVAVAYTSAPKKLGGHRHDGPAWGACGAIALLYGALWAKTRSASARRRRVRDARSPGTLIRWEGRVSDTSHPAVVFVPDTGATIEDYYWLCRAMLASSDFDFVIYDRNNVPGHGKDEWPERGGAQLVGLLDEVLPTKKRAILVGHGSGALIAHAAALHMPDIEFTIVRIPSKYSIESSMALDSDAEYVRDVYAKLHECAVRFGLGPLLGTEGWHKTLPEEARASALAFRRSRLFWSNTAEELGHPIPFPRFDLKSLDIDAIHEGGVRKNVYLLTSDYTEIEEIRPGHEDEVLEQSPYPMDLYYPEPSAEAAKTLIRIVELKISHNQKEISEDVA